MASPLKAPSIGRAPFRASKCLAVRATLRQSPSECRYFPSWNSALIKSSLLHAVASGIKNVDRHIFKRNLFIYYIYVCIYNIWVPCQPVCLYVCVPHAFLTPAEARKGCWIPWDWNYSQLWAVMWVLGIKPSWWVTNDLYQLCHLSSLDFF